MQILHFVLYVPGYYQYDSFSLSLCFNGHFPGETGLAGV